MIWIWAFAILGCFALFLLSGVETAILSVSHVRVLHQAKSGNTRARNLAAMLQDRDNLHTAVVVLNNAIAFSLFAALTVTLVAHYGNRGYAFAFAIGLPTYLTLGELLPKSLCKRFPFRFLVTLFPILTFVHATMLPIIRLGRRTLESLNLAPPVNSTPGSDDPEEAREEFKTLASLMERQGALGHAERVMIQSVVDFQDITVRDVMIPIKKVTAIPVDMPVSSILNLTKQSGLEQFPVMSKTGSLVGLVNIFEILHDKNRKGRAINFVRSLVRAQEDEPAISVVTQLRLSGVQLAVVTDKKHRPLGIVSSEDMISKMITRA